MPKTEEKPSGELGRVDTRIEVARILKECIVPFDFTSLDDKRSKAYTDMARAIVESDTFLNEKATLIGMWTHKIATQCENFDQVRDLQMCIYALEQFHDRLRTLGVLNRRPPPAEDPHAAI